jgi:hypothetical protein
MLYGSNFGNQAGINATNAYAQFFGSDAGYLATGASNSFIRILRDATGALIQISLVSLLVIKQLGNELKFL